VGVVEEAIADGVGDGGVAEYDEGVLRELEVRDELA
jgi:hypothetical protein